MPVVSLAEWTASAARRMDAADLFFGHGTANAFDEACWMAAHVLGLPPDFEDFALGQSLTQPAFDDLERLLIQRIETRKPLAYLVGHAWFAGLRFEVDEHTLIPRSPIAELIHQGLQPWLDLDRPLKVLDVGTGCGCIAAALAWYWPKLAIDAVDISAAALAWAERNVAALELGDRVALTHSDLFEALGTRRYDLIVSNPPYVPERSMLELPPEYRHEPAAALAAGADGLDVVRRLLFEAPEHLTAGGLLLIEVGEAQAAAELLLADSGAVWLEFEHGGEGVFLIDRAACTALRDAARA
ncbi:MAG: 50S ribosomal protein L3 N(5)-glutamine methyltransferase [Xanthomonadaceae bacterium]|nr:50S ribosomal protein L3 N(5)-glutamine methyltransferase [Xanthomonadaceae bacterium]